MLEFWNARERRERLLLLIALGLTIALAVYQFAWRPAFEYKERASRAYNTARADLDYVRDVVSGMGKPQASTANAAPLQSVVVDVAAIYGLTISRIEPAADNGLNLWFEAERPESLYAWLSDLSDNHNVAVGKASMRLVQDGGAVSANLYVNRGQ